jgi:hypothetical protein
LILNIFGDANIFHAVLGEFRANVAATRISSRVGTFYLPTRVFDWIKCLRLSYSLPIAASMSTDTDLLYNCCLILKIHSQILKILLTNLVMSPISKRVMMVLGRCHSNGSTPMTVQRNALVDCSRFACENIQIDGKTPCFGYTQSGWRSFPPALRQSGQS